MSGIFLRNLDLIFLAQPDLNGNEKKYVLDCIESNWISSHGEYIEKFETLFARITERKYAVATNNGTTALHLALVALGVKPGDEILIPDLTYIATANAVSYCGAKPVLVDVLPGTLEIDLRDAESKITKDTVGIIPVHLYGIPANMDALVELCRKQSLFLLEDCAEAHGAKFKERSVGSFGEVSTFSFFGNKILTTGEGGIVTTNSKEIYEKLILFRGQGMDSARRYWFPVIGFNYRMTNVQAALGLAQTERLQEFLDKRNKIKSTYDEGFSILGNKIQVVGHLKDRVSVPWLYNINLNFGDKILRDEILSELYLIRIETRPVFIPLHRQPPYQQSGTWPISDRWSDLGFSIPMHTGLTKADLDFVIENVIRIVNKFS